MAVQERRHSETAALACRVLQDDELNQRFLKDGYVVVPLLDAPAVAQLTRDFERLRPAELEPLHRPQLKPNAEYRKGIDEAIRAAFEPKIEALLNDYRIAVATVVVKEPREPRSELSPHADISLVDESKFITANFWCPLIDTTVKSGCLLVVPGSQNHFFPVRVFSTQKGVKNHPFDQVMPLVIERYTQAIEVPAGHAVVYDGRLIHGSGANMSPNRRIAAVCVMTPKVAPLHLSIPVSSTEAEIFEVPDPSFFWTYQCNDRPVGAKSLGTVVYKLPQLTEADLLNSPHVRPNRAAGWNWRRFARSYGRSVKSAIISTLHKA